MTSGASDTAGDGRDRRDAVIARATEIFLAGRRVEMNELAAYAEVNRNTLFRWFGGRDRLMGEVVWSITAPAFDRVARRAEGEGAVRIANVMGDFASVANRGSAFVPFVRSEPERAFRVMTTQAGGVHHRILARIAAVIEEEVDAGRYTPELPIDDLAFLLLRTAEAYVYSPIITGEQPDTEKARLSCAAVLGVASRFLPARP
ncbi:QsdR family transcriptional regulator [Tsukamurella sp. 1534]|uniref:QsdR family transcriptional regulator n=1 Tax=Tsukamurella sp. 1534 TaxID=1151061 RepID=UPI00031C4CC3|nr:QsdR family transcriptional regulator [Tsukamurella sp. 1534]